MTSTIQSYINFCFWAITRVFLHAFLICRKIWGLKTRKNSIQGPWIMSEETKLQSQCWQSIFTSNRANFSSASNGVIMASIGGISSSFWAAWTLRRVASAANCAARAAFFSSFIFLISRFYRIMETSSMHAEYDF